MSCGGGKFRQLSALAAQHTLAARLSPTIDRLRQKLTDFGLRPYNVSLTWTRWNGQERGEGREAVVRRLSLLPNPLVEDLTGVSLQAQAAGVLPVGSARISRVSPRYSQDLLMGLVMPCDPQGSLESQLAGGPPLDMTSLAIETEQVPEPFEFFYEIVEDGRSNEGRPPVRARFRPLSNPFRKAEQFEWTIVLERVSEDMGRNGNPKFNDGEDD